MNHRWRAALACVGAMGLLLGGAALAAAPAPSPAESPVQTLDDGLVAAMKLGARGGFAGRAAALGPTIDAAFDLPGILRAVVGLGYDAIPAADQAALLTAFRRFTIANYAANFNSFNGQTLSIAPPDRAVGATTLVRTEIASGADSNRIDYAVRQVAGSYRIEDVLLDGTISNVAVQRSDFQRTLAKDGVKGLIAMLDAHSEALANGAGP